VDSSLICSFLFLSGSGTALYGQDASAHVSQALEAGFRHLDAAQSYGNEKSVGAGLASYLSHTSQDRSSIFVTTKFGSKREGQTVKDVLKAELVDLRLDYVDLYLIHSPKGLEGKLGKLWAEFEELKREGLTKEIGISNFRVGDLEELLADIESRGGEIPAVHQVCSNHHYSRIAKCLPSPPRSYLCLLLWLMNFLDRVSSLYSQILPTHSRNPQEVWYHSGFVWWPDTCYEEKRWAGDS